MRASVAIAGTVDMKPPLSLRSLPSKGVVSAFGRSGSTDIAAAHFTRLQAVRAPRIAQGLLLLALVGHALVWGTAAPLGRLPAVGAAIALMGLGWAAWAALSLRQAGTDWRPGAQPSRLVDEGPYRFGRHPMYLGLALVLTGAALGLGSPLLALAVPLFVTVVSMVHIPAEEQRLRQAFGGWYSDYAASVRRWL